MKIAIDSPYTQYSRFMKIAINSPYTQYSKNFKNGGLLCKHIYFENNFYNLFSIHFLQNDDYNCIVSTHKIIHIMSNNLPFNLYVIKYFIYRFVLINISMWYFLSITDVSSSAFSMVSSAFNMAGSAFSMPIKYFIYRSIMSDFFESEPMDIEGEAVCAIRPQVVMAEGEPGAGLERRPKTNETMSLSLEP